MSFSAFVSVFRRLGGIGAVRIFAVGLSFLQALVLARVFGVETYGVFSVAVSVASFASLIGCFGFNEYLMREIARNGLTRAAHDANFKAVLRRSLVIISALTLALTLIGLSLFWGLGVGGVYQAAFFVATLTLAPLVLRKIIQSMALGVKKPIVSISGESLVFPAIIITLAIVVWLFDITPTSEILLFSYMISIVLSLFVVLLLMRKDLFLISDDFRTKPLDKISFGSVLVASAQLSLVASGNMIANHMDSLVLGYLSTPSEAAFARVSWRLAEAIAIIRMISMLHYKPLLAECHGKGDHVSLAANSRILTTVMSGTGILGFLVIFIFAGPLIRLFGPDFADAAPVLRAYAVGSLALMLSGPATVLLTMTGHERICARNFWITLVLNLILNFAFASTYGALGTGIATAISQLILGVLMVSSCRRALNIDTSPIDLLRSMRHSK